MVCALVDGGCPYPACEEPSGSAPSGSCRVRALRLTPGGGERVAGQHRVQKGPDDAVVSTRLEDGERRPWVRRPAGLPRSVSLLAVLALLVVGLLGGVTTPATADPIVPPGASDTVRELAEANARAEGATEASMDAREQLAVRRGEADRTRRESASARTTANAARAERDRAFVGVDRLTRAAYQGGQLDPLSALLGSDSPQSYVDKVSLLDTITTENRAVVQRFLDATAAAETAERDASARDLDAQRSASDAQRTADDATARKAVADRDVATAEAVLRRATPAERASLRSGGITNYPTNLPGSGIAMDALRMALTQQGKPYVWGATGPSTYDCSGLVQWAYKQIGVGLPRVSAAQAQVGIPINPKDSQPGDLMFFNDPVSHVGIYVGSGRFLEAPQSGDVVKVSVVRSNLSAVRRIAL